MKHNVNIWLTAFLLELETPTDAPVNSFCIVLHFKRKLPLNPLKFLILWMSTHVVSAYYRPVIIAEVTHFKSLLILRV